MESKPMKQKYTLEEKEKALRIILESKIPPQVFIDAGHTLRQYKKGNRSRISKTWDELLDKVLKEK
jgi:hypothetical protein